MLSSVFQHLKLKGEKFQMFTSASNQAMEDFERNLKTIHCQLSTSSTKKDEEKSKKFRDFLQQHCVCRQYTFSILKCQNRECPYRKAPRLPEETFNTLHHLPDPILSEGLIHYKSFHESYDKDTEDTQAFAATREEERGTWHGI